MIDHGGRYATSQTWALGGAAAHARGYHWMTFDGPGRQGALVEQGLVLRTDWEAVVTPVVDAVLARADVDPSKLALIGVEHAGYGVARGLAFEHRFAAAVADPGVVDVSTLWTDALPRDRPRRLTGRRPPAFDARSSSRASSTRGQRRVRRRGRWYGLDGRSPYDLYARVREFRLGDEVERISTPILVRHDPHERRWPGQARALYERLPPQQAAD